MKATIPFLALGILSSATGVVSANQTLLSPGDIVFLAANSDAPDTFEFAPLVNIQAGTVIHFTDNSRSGNGTGFGDWRRTTAGAFGESPVYTWIAPTAISAGTKISIPDSTHGSMGLATSGDSIFAFQGDLYNPQFISAVGWDLATPFITTGTATANDSYLPSTLAIGSTAIARTSTGDNTAYTGATTSGTAAALKTAINNGANWSINNTIVLSGPASLTVTDAADAPLATKQLLGYSFGPNPAAYTENPAVIASNTTLSTFAFSGTGTKDIDGSNVLTGQAFQVAGGWDTDSIDVASQYFGFTLTIDPGYGLTLHDFGFAYQSAENITIGAYYSTDGFTTSNLLGSAINVTDTNVGASSLTGLNIQNLTGSVQFRFYGYNAATGALALEIDEVWLQGSVSPVPEPGAVLLGSLGMLGLLRRRR